MKEIAEKRNINIRHKGHVDLEFKVGPFYLDGIDLKNKTIFDNGNMLNPYFWYIIISLKTHLLLCLILLL